MDDVRYVAVASKSATDRFVVRDTETGFVLAGPWERDSAVEEAGILNAGLAEGWPICTALCKSRPVPPEDFDARERACHECVADIDARRDDMYC